MAEPFRPGELLDQSLAAVLGPVDDLTGEAIAGICNDALHAVLGQAVVGALLADRRLLPVIAPWVLASPAACSTTAVMAAPSRVPSACWSVSAGQASPPPKPSGWRRPSTSPRCWPWAASWNRFSARAPAPGTRGRTMRPLRGWPG
jgi:hypothetical protein